MYRVSPFTYLVSSMLSVGVANTNAVCSDVEILHFEPPAGSSCAQYMDPYIAQVGAILSIRRPRRIAVSARSATPTPTWPSLTRTTRIGGGTLASCGCLWCSTLRQRSSYTGLRGFPKVRGRKRPRRNRWQVERESGGRELESSAFAS